MMEEFTRVFGIAFASWLSWYLLDRYRWYNRVIKNNPRTASLITVKIKNSSSETEEKKISNTKVLAPRCSLRQYIRYLYLACVPYAWSVPIKYLKQIFLRQFKNKLTEYEKRQRLAKMVLETSLVLGFHSRDDSEQYFFQYKNFKMPSTKRNKTEYYYVNQCEVLIKRDKLKNLVLEKVNVNNKNLDQMNEMFSFLNTLWCVYTHTLTHVTAGNVAEMNIDQVQSNKSLPEEFKRSIDDMHSVVSGMNESANHYPADIWGISRQNLQLILGYNSVQQIEHHQSIIRCCSVSKFVDFTMKAKKVFTKYLGDTGLSITTLSANTIFHSIDHYNMGKYFLHDSENKSFHGIDSRMITSLLGDLNYDIGKWQAMKYSKCETWRNIYQELALIDKELAEKTHMFVSV